MRFGLYTGVSSALAAGSVIRACLDRPNFYSSCVYIAQSNACLFILTNLALLAMYSVTLGLQKAFYGPLRPVEVEQLWEKAWFALTETALAMTIFRDEVGGWFLFMFTFLLISKVWNWLAEGRVEILEQQARTYTGFFHTRLSAALSLSMIFNIYMLRFCIITVLQQARPNMMVMFAFEFAVLTVLSLSTTARYALSLYETALIKRQIADGRERLRQRTENPLSEEEINSTNIDAAGWEEKGLWTFYLDIATDFVKLVLYLTFFCVLCMFYGMPIHIIRDVALTIRSFYKRIRDFVQYKHATRDMNARYPDATAEEISREDVCIICRENMTAWQDAAGATPAERQTVDERQRAKKLPCGHLLHFACLRSWLERQQICPTCRTPVLNDTSEISNSHQAAGAAAQGRPRVTNPPAGGPRVYTFGPFRLVFGARHINHNPQPNSPPLGAAVSSTDAMMNRNAASISSAGVQAQLNQIEQHITREISNLNTMSDQLQLIRALQSELARLRVSQGLSGHLVSGSNLQQRQMSHLQPQQALQAYRQIPLAQGTQDFPAGLTIPENWTLHALQRVPGHVNAGEQPSYGDEGPSQQPQPAVAHPQGPDSALSMRECSGPVQDSETQNNVDPVVCQAPTAPTLRRNHALGRIESGQTSTNESSIGLPEWGSTNGEDRGSDDQQVGESSRMGSLQGKGKSKAVTIEDDVDD